MTSVRPCRHRSALRPRTPELPDTLGALEELRLIRSTMEQSGVFSAISGWGMVVLGVTAIGAAALGWRLESNAVWLKLWLGEAVVAAAVAALSVAAKAMRARTPVFSGPAARAFSGLAPVLVAGAALTCLLWRAGPDRTTLVAVWLLVYGAAVMAGSTWSVAPLRWMGASFLLLGVISMLSPAGAVDAYMAAGFGGLHIIFGAVIARRYGG